MSTFDINNNNARSSVITFSSTSELSIKFNDHSSTDSFNAAVDAIPLMGLQTRIDKALNLARDEMFTTRNGARPGVPKILVLLTDGAQTGKGSTDPAIPAKQLRDAGVYLIIIGIGKQIDLNEIQNMAGDTGRFYTAASFDELITSDFINGVTETTCPGMYF